MSDDLEQQQRRLRLKKTLKELSAMKGMGTELVTVVIPPEKMIRILHPDSPSDLQSEPSQHSLQLCTCRLRIVLPI